MVLCSKDLGGFMKIWWFVLLGFVIFICIYYKVKIHFNTFIKKGFVASRGPYGCRVFYGPQGCSKTYNMVYEIYKIKKRNLPTFSNVKLNGLSYKYINGLKSLVDIKNGIDDGTIDNSRGVYVVFDELFTELTRFTKLDTDLLDFLSQLRKRKIVLLTSCQSFPDLPLQFRRLCRYAHKCRVLTIPFICSFTLVTVEDAENMVWNKDRNEFEAPICWTDLSKMMVNVSKCYDTNQRIVSS